MLIMEAIICVINCAAGFIHLEPDNPPSAMEVDHEKESFDESRIEEISIHTASKE